MNECARLKEQIEALQEELRLAKEGRQFFYKDAKMYHDQAVNLAAENSRLRRRIEKLELYAPTSAHTNPEDAYRDDFGGRHSNRGVIDKGSADFWSEYLKELEKATYIDQHGIKTY